MTRAIVAFVALALALPAAAGAQGAETNAPPGNSGVDEYLETVPGASGNRRPRAPGQSGGGALTATERARLERLGPDGKALADGVEKTSPSNRSRNDAKAAETDGRSPAGGAIDAFAGSDGGDGMGILLPAILVGALLAAVLFVLLRRRRRPEAT